MPAIARTTTTLARGFVDRLNGIFGFQTGGNGDGKTLPAQSGNPIALMFSMAAELQNRIRIELDRLTTLKDINQMLEEDGFLSGNADKFIALVANYEPRVTFTGTRAAHADQVTAALLHDRLDYLGLRTDYLWRFIMWGDLFLQKELSIDPQLQFDLSRNGGSSLVDQIVRGRQIGTLANVLDLPAHTMFRNSNNQDRFERLSVAFTQVPEAAALWGRPEYAASAINFPLYAVEHARWSHRRQRLTRYGRPALKSVRAQYNKVDVSKFDMLLARHTHSTQLLIFYLNQNVATGSAPGDGITEKDLEAFYESVLRPKKGEFTEISPDTNFILPGQHKVEAVGSAGQFSTSVPEDLYLQIEVMCQGLYAHPRLFGYHHGSATQGRALEAMLWTADQFGDEIRRQEWRQILRPLILWNLWLNGNFTANPDVEWVPRRPPITIAEAKAKGGARPSPKTPGAGGGGGGAAGAGGGASNA
jgi:hypothetical protein